MGSIRKPELLMKPVKLTATTLRLSSGSTLNIGAAQYNLISNAYIDHSQVNTATPVPGMSNGFVNGDFLLMKFSAPIAEWAGSGAQFVW
jgi:hypothetical protein